MLRVYALAPETIRRILRRTFWRFQLLVTASFLAFGLYLALLSGPVRWQLAGPIAGITGLVYFFLIFFHYRQQLRLLYSIRVEMDGSSIVYRQMQQPPRRVMRADIQHAEERKDGLLLDVMDGERLLIPNGLARDGDAEIRAALGAWLGQELNGPPKPAPWGWLMLIGLGGSLLVLIFANNLAVIVPLGALALLYGGYTERRMSRRQDSSPGEVRMYNMAFSFLIFVIVMKSCFLGMALAFMAR